MKISKNLQLFCKKVLTYGNTFAILKTWLRGNQSTVNNPAAKERS
nr:MAG TPA: hypothetical protein [Caudoviricetes sp.]